MNKRLYIIGNGFDIHHGLKSSYWHFRSFVELHDKTLFENLEKYFNPDDLWSDFESTLEHLDTEKIVDEASNYLNSYGDPNWKDSMHHDYQYEIDTRIKILTTQLKQRFTEWVLQLSPPQVDEIKFLGLNTNSFFLTFNYTLTLEKLYGIKSSNILHIHNKIEDINSNLILGHSREPNESNSFNKDHDEDDDVRVIEGNKLLDAYFEFTYKTTTKLIHDNITFFKNLEGIEEIYVLGHSMAEVDSPYFQKIIEIINIDKVLWKVSYHFDFEAKKHHSFLTKLGILDKNIVLDKITNFNNPQDNQLEIPL